MNDATMWRLALARQIGAAYGVSPNVAAVYIAGSVARGWADRYSDIELDVYWSTPPSDGERLEIIRRAGGENVAAGLKGFWADVSPEQVALWDPDVIFLGSSWGNFGVEEVYRNSQFQTVTAVKKRRVFTFPSNVGWWDFPPPHCVLGIVWAAKAMYPERFADVDMLRIADDFYAKYRGHTFTALGGRL